MRGKKRTLSSAPRHRINESIRAPKVRVLDEQKVNIGILSTKEAIDLARNKNLDLVEVSDDANPPVARICDYGKFVYGQNKLKKTRKETTKKNETKTLQIKIGTGQDILNLRAKNIRKWLDQGYTVHIDLFLFGRYKTMDETFLKSKLQDFLSMIPGAFSTIGEIRKGGKGFVVVIQPSK